jgi:uncharacterized protein YodC (DUF2158 family)
MAFKKGDVVRLSAVIPEGPVLALRMNEDGEIFCLLEWVDAEGEAQQRWFSQDQLVAAGT